MRGCEGGGVGGRLGRMQFCDTADCESALHAFAQHLVKPDQGAIHHLLAGADGDWGDFVVGAVTTLRDRFDGGKVLVVAVAVAEEKELLNPRTFLQTDRVVAEELAGSADERKLA